MPHPNKPAHFQSEKSAVFLRCQAYRLIAASSILKDKTQRPCGANHVSDKMPSAISSGLTVSPESAGYHYAHVGARNRPPTPLYRDEVPTGIVTPKQSLTHSARSCMAGTRK